jgi:nucleotide-binding universal stress UspA family protein
MSAPFRKIMVPVDFSAHSSEAVRVAADLSRRYQVPITLLHVHEPPVYAVPSLFSASQLNAIMGELEKKLADDKERALAAGASHVDTMMVQGTPFLRIIEAAREGGHDLIVMGTHGHTGVRHLLIGSVAERVVRKAHCPVLVVRDRAHHS